MRTENLQRQKLIVLGDGRCGKTSLINAMITGKSSLTQGNGANNTQFIDYTIWRTENDVDFMVHDIGGNVAYHMLFPMIMDSKALYLVVYDHRKYTPQSYTQAIGQWLDIIQIHAPGAVIKITGTQCDQVDNPLTLKQPTFSACPKVQ